MLFVDKQLQLGVVWTGCGIAMRDSRGKERLLDSMLWKAMYSSILVKQVNDWCEGMKLYTVEHSQLAVL